MSMDADQAGTQELMWECTTIAGRMAYLVKR